MELKLEFGQRKLSLNPKRRQLCTKLLPSLFFGPRLKQGKSLGDKCFFIGVKQTASETLDVSDVNVERMPTT